ncbi:MAG: proline dehydrogenase family protein, partial [Deltaproteobacteria bacterium]|nr:proline dehydrogenase family protein [Deltaproteobacteria bacterium]
DKFEFQMLLGIRRDLQRQLLKDGWRVRIYVPYGSAWLPYTLRRIRERKENLWFVVKNIFRR